MPTSAWFVGSQTLAAQTLAITQGATTENIVLPAGSYYLRSATSSLSLLAAMVTAINAHSLISGATAVVQRNRIVALGATQTFTLTWPADNILRNLLGFAANLTPAATSHTAPAVSPLLWSPGYLATPATIEGVTGYTVPHQAIYKSDDGTQVDCDHYGSETWQDLEWTHVLPERMRVATGTGGGTFHEFYEQCGMLRRRFLYHQEIDELDGSTTAVTWDTALGCYVLRPDFPDQWYRRNVQFAEVSSPLELPIHLVDEYA